MDKKSILFQLAFLQFLSGFLTFNSMNVQIRCLQIERKVLLDFKQGLTDPSGRLSSWVGEECCQWDGLTCNNLTGHVIKLDLRNPFQSDEAGHQESALRGQNRFWGSLPETIGSLSSLEAISMFGNPTNGSIPESMGQLSKLIVMNFGQTLWKGTISERHFLNLTRLENLEISSTSLKKSLNFNVGSQWNPPFKLKSIILAHIQAGPMFPEWVQTQNDLTRLFLNDIEISSTLPDWFWSWCSQHIDDLDLAHNQIRGTLPRSLHFHYEANVYLISNQFRGPLPMWSNVRRLYLWGNSFSGLIPENISEIMPKLRDLDLSENCLSGGIPPSIVNLRHLNTLVLSFNHLSGELPADWSQLQHLQVLDVSNNNLSGTIPSSIGFLHSLQLLSLSNNKFTGKIPLSLQNCTGLWNFDLSENRLSGSIPAWMGNITSLLILHLRSNFLSSELPTQLCHLLKLHVLDLADNNLLGWIPQCLGNLSGMISDVPPEFVHLYQGHATLVAKGRELEYSSTLSLVKTIDLSANNLTGKVPEEITGLLRLGTLNLSMNHLTGRIPPMIGSLRWLETLDLSKNQLSGTIPSSLSMISSLSHLNLSYNNLTGKIPLGNQLQTLNDPSIYEGNPGLCGDPLKTKCPEDDTSSESSEEGNGENERFDILWFYFGVASGFIVGFWAVCGAMLLNKSWRQKYFKFIDERKDKACVFIAVTLAHWQGRMKSIRNRDRQATFSTT
ncbi:receptor-like protein EIX1 [Hevea brasiliensis]|uniref:receptor-like protein EIX1 n=1 Tax=Hevea brasiliensis TaxID=3981 RepID=UPI0025FEC776|nr:receptor-like protein EIX1 [Hevea brasiliensis]